MSVDHPAFVGLLVIVGAALAVTLTGCGSGASPLPAHSCTPTGQCSHCDPVSKACLACAPGYGLDPELNCIALCLLPNYTKPMPPHAPGVYNGYAWPQECINATTKHFFAIGDWGGVKPGVPAFNIKNNPRPEIKDIDEHAQDLVANVMNKRAATSRPSFVLNVGDNFYWGGIPVTCGTASQSPSMACSDPTFHNTFENIYKGDGMDGVPWFSVMGNHDFGGIGYSQGWDLQIYYSFCPNSRWRLPGLWWSQKIQFRDFSMDIFMLDSNHNDALSTAGHTLCKDGDGCQVPNATIKNDRDCVGVMNSWWSKGLYWLEQQLQRSTAEWQVVVTHFPPTFRPDDWKMLVARYNIDLIVTGHMHEQDLHLPNDKSGKAGPLAGNFPATWIVTGGGGGITSEPMPDEYGFDDAYGFVDFTVSKDEMKIEMLSHEAVLRRSETIRPRAKRQDKLSTVSKPLSPAVDTTAKVVV